MNPNRYPLLLVAVLTTLLTLPALAQRGSDKPRVSPNASVSQTIGVTEVTISYGRPGVKGRTVWGELVPYGKVWRTGANEATTISFSKDVIIEGELLPAGTYGLFTVPKDGEWIIVFNKNAQQWGAFDYEASQDALRVKVKPQAADKQEWMSFSFEDLSPNGATVVLRWDKLAVPFKIQTAQ